MKTLLLNLVLFFSLGFCAQTATAQTAADKAALETMWNSVLHAFDSGDMEAMWAAYTDDAAEIGPDGSLTSGKAALRASWDGFMKIVDEKPKFTYTNISYRFITPDVAIATWDGDADIKVGGQQVGGKTKGMAVLHKINGKWFIEFDSITPLMQMPAQAPTGN